ncbi:MAG: O-antigen ligase family protein [Clostridia bacterium]|nr:O-antigen ligase family protein [Clostridia bacterium]
MQNNKISKSYGWKELVWLFSLTLLFTVSNNVHWRSSHLIWYGAIALFLFSYLLTFNVRIVISNFNCIAWFFCFITFGVLSVFWSDALTEIIDVLKSLTVIFVIILFIQFSINSGFKIVTLLKCYFVALIINTIYIVFTIDISGLGDVQLGTGLIEGWNGNGIGFMTAQGALIAWYLFGTTNYKIEKVFLCVCVIALSVLTMYTGSRTAFLMLIAQFVLYVCLGNPSKMLRNFLIAVLIVSLALYLVMNVDSFYKVLGHRLEGLFSLFKGDGEIDSSANIRDVFIQNGKEWFLDKPILGFGLNAYKTLNVIATGRYTYAHNNFIELAVDLGLVGLILYYGAYLYLIVKLFKSFKNNHLIAFLLSALIASLVSHFGTVDYYGLYQNLLLLLCFNAVNFSKGNNKDKLL